MANEPSLAKTVGGPVQDFLLRPFIRRMKYLYTGVLERDDVFVLATVDERQIKQADPAYALAVVQVSDPVIRAGLRDWLRSFYVDPDQPGVVQITTIASALNKVKWDITKMPLTLRGDGIILLGSGEVPEDEADAEEFESPPRAAYLVETDEEEEEEEDDLQKLSKILVFHPITSYYNYSKIRSMAQEYCAVFIDKTTPSHFVPMVAPEVDHTLRVVVEADEMRQSVLGHVHQTRLRTMLTRGLDLIHHKHLLVTKKKPKGKKATTPEVVPEPPPDDDAPPPLIGIRLWLLSGGTLGCGHCFQRPDVTLAAIRFNAPIVPRLF